jgi:uncharacterized OB-fold protein
MFMPQPVEKIYYAGLDEGKIRGTKCSQCGAVEWPPMPTCNQCGSIDMEWCEIKGEAVMDDFYPCPLNLALASFESYFPYYWFVGRLVEGTGISGIVFGISKNNEEQLRLKLPLKLKPRLLQMVEFKTVAWEIAVEDLRDNGSS